jgi:hypothetical protein
VFLACRIAPNGDGASAADHNDAALVVVAHGSAQGSALISRDYYALQGELQGFGRQLPAQLLDGAAHFDAAGANAGG